MKYNNNNNSQLFHLCPHLHLLKLLCVVHRKIVQVLESLFANCVGTVRRRFGDIFQSHSRFFGELCRGRFELNIVEATSGLEVVGLFLEQNVLLFKQRMVCGDNTGGDMVGVLTFILDYYYYSSFYACSL